MAACAEGPSWAHEDTHRRSPDRKRLQASQHHVVFERRVLRQQAYSAKPFQEARKGQTCLSTGQRCTQTVVHPTAKGKMAGFTAGDVKLLWGVEYLGIVVGSTEQQHNALAFDDTLPADLDILERRAKIYLHRRIIAQH